jgi:tRNA(Ile)-lysidine synthase TilS/MesJ
MSVKISKKILRKVGQAQSVNEFFKKNDRIILGLSGGKDSITLAHVLKHFQKVTPYKFEFLALTISYGMDGENYSELSQHCKDNDINHKIIKTNIFELSKEKIRKNSSFCSFFSRMRRGALYKEAISLGFNKLALGHHLDDAVESFFMNFTYNGALRSLPPKYIADNGLEIIRPLIYVRERQLIDAAYNNQFPIISDENCPAFRFDVKMPHARASMKQLLFKLEQTHPDLFVSLKSAFSNIHHSSF